MSKYFISRYAFTIVNAMKKAKNLDGPNLETYLVLTPTIIPQGILIIHCPPVSIMIRNNFRINKLDYLPIHYPYLLLLTLQHSLTRKGWHDNNIIFRINLKQNKLFIVPFTTYTSHITNMFLPEVLNNSISVSTLRTISPLFINALP